MEYKTSGLSPEEELELIRSYIPTANNLPKNLNTLRLMGLEEADIRVIFKGEPLLVFEGIKNPFTGDKVLAGVTQITIDRKDDECREQVFINSRPAEEFFAEPIPKTEPARDIESLTAENEQLHEQLRNYQERYDDIWEYCKDLERKCKEMEQKSRN